MRVVVGDVLAQHRLELPARHDQDPVETFAPDAADPALGMRFRPWRRDRRPDRPEPFRTEDLVESGREFLVAVADQDPMALPLLGEGHDQVARLLHDPSPVGMGGDAGEIHATPRQLDEKEHVEAAQPKRLDREEVTLKDHGRLLTQELPPAHARASRCGLDAMTLEHVPDATRREPDPEPDEFNMDALVSPTRVLRRQTQDQLSRLCEERRPTRPSALIRPAAADEVTMPAQKRRRLDQERARPRQKPAECSQQDTIGRPQTRPTYLAPQHLQLMAQHQDLHLLRPLRTTKQNQQLEQTANDPVNEEQTLKQQTSRTHRPTLPARTTPSYSPLHQPRGPAERRTSLWDPHPGDITIAGHFHDNTKGGIEILGHNGVVDLVFVVADHNGDFGVMPVGAD